MLEFGWTALVFAGFGVAFGDGIVTVTAGRDITIEDVRLVRSFVAAGCMLRQQGRTFTITPSR